jgi:hypothetical protein
MFRLEPSPLAFLLLYLHISPTGEIESKKAFTSLDDQKWPVLGLPVVDVLIGETGLHREVLPCHTRDAKGKT